MIKRIIGIIIPLLTCVTLVAQENANIYRVIYLKAKAGQKEQFLAGLKEHTKISIQGFSDLVLIIIDMEFYIFKRLRKATRLDTQ